MNGAATASRGTQPGKLSLRTVLDAWRGITREQIVTTFLLGCALHVYRMVVTINLALAPFIFVADQLKAFAILLAIVVVDRMTGNDPDRRGAYALAVLVAAAIVVPITILTVISLVIVFTDVPPRPPGRLGFVLNIFFELLMVGGATVWVINDRRRARRARIRMHMAELGRIKAERRSIESDLQAMQARIEPQFLLNTLTQVRRLFSRSHLAGEQLLDALIAYLRAAMPGMRDTSSTVQKELDLARAYLAIPKLGMGERLAVDVEVSEDVAEARMPAMLLLPLIDHALSQALPDKGATASIQVRASLVESKVRCAISVIGGNPIVDVDDDRISSVRMRLFALFGSHATLATRRPDASSIEIELALPSQGAGGAREDLGA